MRTTNYLLALSLQSFWCMSLSGVWRCLGDSVVGPVVRHSPHAEFPIGSGAAACVIAFRAAIATSVAEATSPRPPPRNGCRNASQHRRLFTPAIAKQKGRSRIFLEL